MQKILGRKKSNTNDKWQYAVDHIEELVTYAELMGEVKKAVNEIREVTANKRVAFAWSGGKDSIVLADICKKAGVKKCVFGHTEVEYPAFLEWCFDHLPDNCDIINTAQNIDWLAQHPEMVFPDAKHQQKWYVIVQRTAFTEYFFKNKLDILIVGHRLADGNVVGENGFMRKQSGEVRWSPLYKWSHELILAYIHYFKLDIPPIYGWKDGYKCGTHPWPSRMGMESVEQGWREVYEIDPQIVAEAAQKIPSAREFLAKTRLTGNKESF